MIQLRINGVFVDLISPEISYKITSPMFTNSEVYGEYTDLPFSIAKTPETEKALGWVGHINRPNAPSSIACEIFLNGTKLRDGIVKVKSVTQTYFKCVFSSGISRFAEAFKNTKLSDLPFPDLDVSTVYPSLEVFLMNTTGTNLTIYYADEDAETLINAASSPYKTKTYTNTYTGGSPTAPEAIAAIVNDINTDYNAGVIPFWAEAAGGGGLGSLILYHDYYFWHSSYTSGEWDPSAIATASSNTWFCGSPPNGEANTSIGSEGAMQNLREWVKLVNDQDGNVVFPMVRNFANTGDLTDVDDLLNIYAPDTDEYLIEDGSINGAFVPFVKLRHVVEKVLEDLNYEVFGDFFEDDWFNKIVLYCNVRISTDNINGSIWYPTEGSPFTFNAADFVPDITIQTLFRAMEKHLGIQVVYDKSADRLLILRYEDFIESSKFINVDDILASPVVIEPDSDFSNGFVIGLKEDSSDSYLSGHVSLQYEERFTDQETFGLGEKNFLSDSTWVYQDYYSGDLSNSVYVPAMKIATSNQFEKRNSTQVKLLIYHGYQDALGTTDKYPLASQHSIDAKGHSLSTKTLSFTAELPGVGDPLTFTAIGDTHTDELVSDAYRNWFTFLLTSRSVKFKMLMTPAQFQKIAPDTVFRTKYAKFIFKELEAKLTNYSTRIEVDVEAFVV